MQMMKMNKKNKLSLCLVFFTERAFIINLIMKGKSFRNLKLMIYLNNSEKIEFNNTIKFQREKNNKIYGRKTFVIV